MVNTPDPFEERSRELFDDSVERLDARTRSRLNQARQRALEEMKKGSGPPLLARRAARWLGRGRSDRTDPDPRRRRGCRRQRMAATMLDDFDIVADADNFELIQDVEFYSWLAGSGR